MSAGAGLSSLSELIAPMGLQDFIEEVLGRSTRLFPGSQKVQRPTFDMEDFEALLWCNEPRLHEHLSVCGSHGDVALPRRPRSKDLFRWSVDRYCAGCTLGFQRAELVLPWAAGLAGDAAARLLSRASVEILLLPERTAPGARSVGLDEDVLVLQTSGKSLWRPCNGPGDTRLDARGGEAVLLEPGDAVYLPASWAYLASPQCGPSITVLLHLRALMPHDLLECIIEIMVEEDADLRRSVPLTEDALRGAYALAVAKVESLAASSELNRRAWDRLMLRLADEYRPAPGGHLSGARVAASVTTGSILRKRRGAPWVVSSREDAVYVFVPGLGGVAERESQPGGLMFPAVARGLLSAILEVDGTFLLSDLPAEFSERALLATVRTLVRAGALEVVPDADHLRTSS